MQSRVRALAGGVAVTGLVLAAAACSSGSNGSGSGSSGGSGGQTSAVSSKYPWCGPKQASIALADGFGTFSRALLAARG